jgi:hypothetical protein
MKRICIAGLAFSLAAPRAEASDWQQVATGTDLTVALIDTSSVKHKPPIAIRRPFPVTQVWVKFDYTLVKKQPLRSRLALKSFNCEDRTSATLSMTGYRPDGSAAGGFTEEDYDFEYEPVTPDSIMEGVMEAACSPQDRPSDAELLRRAQ